MMDRLTVLFKKLGPGAGLVVGILIIIFLSGLIGYSFQQPQGGIPTPIIKEVTSREAQKALEDLRLEAEGWKARALARREIQPEEVLVATGDTLECPPSLVEVVRIEGPTRASVARMVLAGDSLSAPGYTRRIDLNYAIGRCQELSISGDQVVCDEPRFGVLDVFASAGSSFEGDGVLGDLEFATQVGMEWRRFPGSKGRFQIGYDPISRRVSVGFNRKFNLFGF